MKTFTLKKKHRYLPVLLFFLAQCGPDQKVYELFGPTMGTRYHVQLIAPAGIDTNALQAAIETELELVNQQMSNWLADSDVSRFNAHAGEAPLSIQPETRFVLERTLALAKQTGGALDPTLSPLIELWGFGTADRQVFPDDGAIREALARTGYHHLRLSEAGLARAIPGITLNLSATAKGYAVDRVAAYLKQSGYNRFLVDVGGEGRATGLNARKVPWHVGIEDPRLESGETIYRVMRVEDLSFATSGDYRNFFKHEGKHYSHILHPGTGRPVRAQLASATVLAPDCLTADGLATAFLVMDPEEAIALTNALPEVASLLLVREEDGTMSERMCTRMNRYLLPATGEDRPTETER